MFCLQHSARIQSTVSGTVSTTTRYVRCMMKRRWSRRLPTCCSTVCAGPWASLPLKQHSSIGSKLSAMQLWMTILVKILTIFCQAIIYYFLFVRHCIQFHKVFFFRGKSDLVVSAGGHQCSCCIAESNYVGDQTISYLLVHFVMEMNQAKTAYHTPMTLKYLNLYFRSLEAFWRPVRKPSSGSHTAGDKPLGCYDKASQTHGHSRQQQR